MLRMRRGHDPGQRPAGHCAHGSPAPSPKMPERPPYRSPLPWRVGTFADAQTVDVTVQESGTDAAVDFTAVQGFSITIDAHATTGSGAFTITPTDDTVDELDERVAVLSSHPNAYDSAFVALVDNDATPLGITLAASPSTPTKTTGPRRSPSPPLSAAKPSTRQPVGAGLRRRLRHRVRGGL